MREGETEIETDERKDKENARQSDRDRHTQKEKERTSEPVGIEKNKLFAGTYRYSVLFYSTK